MTHLIRPSRQSPSHPQSPRCGAFERGFVVASGVRILKLLLLSLVWLFPMPGHADPSGPGECTFQPSEFQARDAGTTEFRSLGDQLSLPPRLRPVTSEVLLTLPAVAQRCWLVIDRVSLYGLEVEVAGLPPSRFDFFNPTAQDRFASAGYTVALPPHEEARQVRLTLTQLGVLSTRVSRLDDSALIAQERRLVSLQAVSTLAPALMSMLVLVFWLRLRDRAIAAYLAMLISLLLTTASLDGTLYFTALGELLSPLRSMVHILMLSLFGLSVTQFFKEFLSPLDQSGLRVYRLLMSIFAFTAVSSLLGIPVFNAIIQHATTFSLLLTAPLLIWQSYRSWRQGNRLAAYFLIGWSMPLLFIPVRLAAEYGLVEWGFWIRYLPRIAFVLEALVFAYGLADRVLQVRIERDRARQDRLRIERTMASYRELVEADSLTGLASRRSLETTLTQWDQSATRGSALFIDLDRFKQLNDLHGHAAGDRVLREVSDAIRDSLPADAHIARYGGEELVALLLDAAESDAIALAEQVRQSVSQRLTAPGNLSVTVSIGVAVRNDDEPMASTLARADAALYRAKKNGRNRVEAGA